MPVHPKLSFIILGLVLLIPTFAHAKINEVYYTKITPFNDGTSRIEYMPTEYLRIKINDKPIIVDGIKNYSVSLEENKQITPQIPKSTSFIAYVNLGNDHYHTFGGSNANKQLTELYVYAYDKKSIFFKTTSFYDDLKHHERTKSIKFFVFNVKNSSLARYDVSDVIVKVDGNGEEINTLGNFYDGLNVDEITYDDVKSRYFIRMNVDVQNKDSSYNRKNPFVPSVANTSFYLQLNNSKLGMTCSPAPKSFVDCKPDGLPIYINEVTQSK